jgi:DNA-binding response OmpR family regulator
MSTKSILIVEDDISIRDVLSDVIEGETPYHAFVAQDGETALNMLQNIAPDMFLVDYRLPGMNGVQFIDRIRKCKKYQHTPIVIMSACQSWLENLRGTRYLAKPFELDVFLGVVEESLDSPERG